MKGCSTFWIGDRQMRVPSQPANGPPASIVVPVKVPCEKSVGVSQVRLVSQNGMQDPPQQRRSPQSSSTVHAVHLLATQPSGAGQSEAAQHSMAA